MPKLFQQVIIPPIVAEEFLASCTIAEQKDFEACKKSVLAVTEINFTGSFTRQLDSGEKAVLSLALQEKLDTVLIDDRKAFNEAKECNLIPVSTRALLQTAVRLGIISDFYELEKQLREQQFFLPKY